MRVLYEKFIPEDRAAAEAGQAISAEEILALAGDANRGRIIFFKSSAAQCKQCHAVQGFGGTLGPELTNIGKKYERKTLLETILDPVQGHCAEFVPYLLETKSGQVYAGFLVEKTDRARRAQGREEPADSRADRRDRGPRAAAEVADARAGARAK